MKNIEKINELLRLKYEASANSDILEAYVMSELTPPIEDYVNAHKLICDSLSDALPVDLIIVGAHLEYMWIYDGSYPCLSKLESILDMLDVESRAITYYLQALMYDNRKDKNMYSAMLEKSISLPVKFVYNHVWYARLCRGAVRKQHYQQALAYVHEVLDSADGMSMAELLSARAYICEEILGTHMSTVNYLSLKEECAKS